MPMHCYLLLLRCGTVCCGDSGGGCGKTSSWAVAVVSVGAARDIVAEVFRFVVVLLLLLLLHGGQ